MAVLILASARLTESSHYSQDAMTVALNSSQYKFALINSGGQGIIEVAKKGAYSPEELSIIIDCLI
jgi:predicted Rossmann-fold nucleotide-binding protein